MADPGNQRPRLAHRLGRGLLALLLLGLLLGGGYWLSAWVMAPEHMSLARVRIEGELKHTHPAVLQQTLGVLAVGSFFALDLERIRTAVEALPWIAKATVRRVWPLSLVVRIEERDALARWGDNALISTQGRVFTPEPESIPPGLIRLDGPVARSSEVLDRYRWIHQQLETQNLKLARLELTARDAWYVEVENGPRLSLGNRNIEARLERFLHHLPRLAQGEMMEQVDLRYGNGFAVRLRPPVPPVATKQRSGKG